MSSNPAGGWAFFLLYPMSSASSVRSLMEVQHNFFSKLEANQAMKPNLNNETLLSKPLVHSSNEFIYGKLS